MALTHPRRRDASRRTLRALLGRGNDPVAGSRELLRRVDERLGYSEPERPPS